MAFQDGFISELVGRRATVNELPIGRVTDFLVNNPDQTFPEVDGLIIKTSQGPRFAPMDTVSDVDADGAVALNAAPKIAAPPDDEALYLVLDLLDKQIVDVDGRKVVRINDIEIANTGGKLRVVAADVGVSGLLRRLGLRGIGKRLTPWVYGRVPRAMIAWDSVAPIREKNPSQVQLAVKESKLTRLHPSELAEVISDLSAREAAAIIHSLDDETAADALEHLEPEKQRAIIDDIGRQRAADIIEEMDSDDAADLLGDLPEDQQSELLAEMNQSTAGELRELVKYEDDTAGGLMTTDYVWILPHRTAEQTIHKIREIAPETEFIYYLYVLDKDERLLGVLTLRSLLLAPQDDVIERIMEDDIVTIAPAMQARDVAATIARYDLLAVPVVDPDGLMLGIVTVDDAIDAIMPEDLAKELPRITPTRRTSRAVKD
ncbi:MAG TPA: CBS domain-containing protein [Candidatus Rubrimentiphilum sp.]|nr:CBS domain-containing protein [Candidatus Rubrimentiphilum sp.]